MCFDVVENKEYKVVYKFQSPLHRGMCFDPQGLFVAWLNGIRFSPLFIGACVSTNKKEKGSQNV